MKILFESIDTTGEFKSSPAYADYKALIDEIAGIKPRSRDVPQEYPEKFFSDAELYVRYGPFRKIGKGSSRTAYSFDSDRRYALKFAHNNNGLAQNQTELRNVQAGTGDYRCMVRILDFDEDAVFIVEDMCRESTYSDWNRIIGVSPNMLSKIVRVVFERKKADGKFTLRDLLDEIRDFEGASRILKKSSAMDDEVTKADHPKIVECVENLVAAADGKPVAEKWTVLYDLFRFYFDNGLSAMIPEELLYVDQWGVRPGKTPAEDSLIIIDPGVDEDFMPFVGQDGRVR